MRARWELAPAAARARGHAGNQRLHQRWLHFNDRRKDPGDRERRDRPRAGRPVLVPGRDGRLTGAEAHGSYDQEQPSQAPPRSAGGRSSAGRGLPVLVGSTSFMLAGLCVIHVDTSHAPAGIAWIEEFPS
jgi:hypothetical protein